MSYLMILEPRFLTIVGEREIISIDTDDTDTTGMYWLQMPLKEGDETSYAREPIVTPTEILDQFYYSGIVI